MGWNTVASHCIQVGTVTSPVTRLLNVHGRIWCSMQGIIKILDTDTLTVSECTCIGRSVIFIAIFFSSAG